MENFYPTKSLWGQPTKHKPIYLVGLLWFDRMVHNLSLCAGLPRNFQHRDLSSHLAFSGQSIYKPNFFMNYWVHAVKDPTSLWVGRLTKCTDPTSQWHFESIVLVLFFVVWIVVTVSVRGDSPTYIYMYVYIHIIC